MSAGSLPPARRIPAGRLPRGELLYIAFVFAKNACKYLKLVLRTQTVRYLLRNANPSRNKKFQPLVQIVRQGSRGQCVHAPGCFNGASPALPRRPSGLPGRAKGPISFPLRFVEAPLKQGSAWAHTVGIICLRTICTSPWCNFRCGEARCEENIR